MEADLEVLQELARALRNLCQDTVVQAGVVAYGGIALFVELSLPGDPILQAYSAQALGLLSQEPHNQYTVLKEGGLQALLSSTSSREPEVATLALDALLKLSKFDEGRQYIAGEATARLLGVLKGDNPEERSLSGAVLASLSENLTAHAFLAKNQAPSAVMSCLKDPLRPESHVVCAQILAGHTHS